MAEQPKLMYKSKLGGSEHWRVCDLPGTGVVVVLRLPDAEVGVHREGCLHV